MLYSGYQQRRSAGQINLGSPQARGLVGFWPLDDNAGTILRDLSPLRRAATAVGGATCVGDNLKFVSGTQYATTSVTDLSFPAATISWWQFNTQAYNAGVQRCSWGQDISGKGLHFQVYSNNQIYAGWINGTDARVTLAASASNYPQNIWTHYALEWSTLGTTLYCNGALIGSAGAPTVGNFAASLTFAATPFETGFIGGLRDFRIYNRRMGAAGVLDLYRNPNGLYLPRRMPVGSSAITAKPWLYANRNQVVY